MADPISPAEFSSSEGLDDWRLIGEGACAFFRTASFGGGARLVEAIAALPAVGEHPPDIDIRRDGVTVRLITIAEGYFGVSRQDVELARRISDVARDLGVVADPAAVQSIVVIPGAPDVAAVMPFWQAILGYEPRSDTPDEDLVDPRGRGPGFWFERMEEPRAGGGGTIHISVWVPHDQAEARVAAALAAGGRMVRDLGAPAWWTLADAAGNEADVSSMAAPTDK